MRHVFVETNWVVGYAAPAHHQHPDARALFERAEAGELRLYLPSVCLSEARFTIPRKLQPRTEADAIRKFLVWARAPNRLEPEQIHRKTGRQEGRNEKSSRPSRLPVQIL